MTLGSHQQTIGKSQIHCTPRWILEALGLFDLDPCAADPRPWGCAKNNFTEAQDGLAQVGKGRVFLNPPFNRYLVARWIQKLAAHGHGIALLHARTEAGWFRPVWEHASGILFLSKRIYFHQTPDGFRVDGLGTRPHRTDHDRPHQLGALTMRRKSTPQGRLTVTDGRICVVGKQRAPYR